MLMPCLIQWRLVVHHKLWVFGIRFSCSFINAELMLSVEARCCTLWPTTSQDVVLLCNH